jgi:hypothetical protein
MPRPDEWQLISKESGRWVVVKWNGTLAWVPKFEDLVRPLVGIGICEDEKYQEDWHERRHKVTSLIIDALRHPASEGVFLDDGDWLHFWEPLRIKHQIPAR